MSAQETVAPDTVAPRQIAEPHDTTLEVTAPAETAETSRGAARHAVNRARETSTQANAVFMAAQQVSQNLQTLATGAEEMGASIMEIAKNATEAAKVAMAAVCARIVSRTFAASQHHGESQPSDK